MEKHELLANPCVIRVIPIHGVPSNSTDLYALTGQAYSDYKTTDFLPGGAWC